MHGFWLKESTKRKKYWQGKLIDALRKKIYLNGWPRERPYWSRKPSPTKKKKKKKKFGIFEAAPKHYRRITCLPMEWKMKTLIIQEIWSSTLKQQLYGYQPPIMKTTKIRRTSHGGRCWRSRDKLIKDVLLWISSHSGAKAGRSVRTYMQQLCEDTGCIPEDLPEAIVDRKGWWESVWDIRADSRT